MMAATATAETHALEVACRSAHDGQEYGTAGTVPLDAEPGDVVQMVAWLNMACAEYENNHGLPVGTRVFEWQIVRVPDGD